MDQKIHFIFEVMQMKLNQLHDVSNALDQKISSVAGFLATIIAGSIIFFKNELKINFCPLSTNFFTLGIILLLCAILLCIYALATKMYYYPPHENELYSKESLSLELDDLKEQIIADMKEGFVKNHKIHEYKAKIFNISLYFLAIAMCLIIIQYL